MTAPSAAWSVRVRTASADHTRALASALSRLSRPGDVVLLVGGLGAGKTTFAQGFARGLGVTGPVTSPTFTLVRQYPCSWGSIRSLLHADVYRLDTLVEVADLALVELVEGDAVALVEWGDAASPVLGPDNLTVTLRHARAGEGESGDEVRDVAVEARGAGWRERLEPAQRAITPFLVGPVA